MALEDDLMRRFGSDRLSSVMQKLGMSEGEPITHPWISKAIENAQKKVEEHNFEIRKQLLEYDDVMNKQREVIYAKRKEILKGEKLNELILEMAEQTIDDILHKHIENPDRPEEWDFNAINNALDGMLSIKLELPEDQKQNTTAFELKDMLLKKAKEYIEEKQKAITEASFSELVRFIFLQVLDSNWKDFLLNMDHLKEGIGLRGYAQKDPLIEYKKEAFDMFQKMLSQVSEESITRLYKIQIQEKEDKKFTLTQRMPLKFNLNVTQPAGMPAMPAAQPPPGQGVTSPIKRENKKIGRNDPCWCGSGKKYKNCHGKEA